MQRAMVDGRAGFEEIALGRVEYRASVEIGGGLRVSSQNQHRMHAAALPTLVGGQGDAVRSGDSGILEGHGAPH